MAKGPRITTCIQGLHSTAGNANRYTFLWGNSIKTNKEKMKLQLDELWKYAQGVAASELDNTDPDGFDKIDKQKL